MTQVTEAFEERILEIEAYLEFVQAIEDQARRGPPEIGNGAPVVSPQQQRILYSSVYLQLYNLVEATVTWCLESVVEAATGGGGTRPTDLCDELRHEWVRIVVSAHGEPTDGSRLRAATWIFDHLAQAQPLARFRLDRGGGGNWDDLAIEEMSARLGLPLQVSDSVFRGIKRHVRDDMGPLKFVKELRNQLAHGRISFEQCSEGVAVSELRDLKDRIVDYLRAVVESFDDYLREQTFLQPSRRQVQT